MKQRETVVGLKYFLTNKFVNVFFKISILPILFLANVAWAEAGDPEMGDVNLGSQAIKITSELHSVKSSLLTIAQVVGLGMALGGCISMYKSVKYPSPNSSVVTSIALIIIGVAAFFIGTVMGGIGASFLK